MLKEILKKIGQHTLIYSVGNILSRMIGFFMIPVYTHYLTPGDYGVIELLDLTTYFISMVIGVGMSHAILRFYYEYQDQEQRNQVISTAFIFTLGILVLALAVLYPLSQRISQLIFGTVQYRPYLQIIFATMCLGILIELALSYVRAKQQSVKYTLFSIIRLILALSLNIYFIAFLRLGIWGVLYSGLISSGLMALLLVLMAFLDVRISFSLKKLKSMLRYGIPLIHSGLGMFVLTFADRFFLQKYATLSDVGIYSLGYKLGMVIGALVVSPFLLFWAAYMYEIAEKPNAKYLFARIHVYYTFVLVFSSLGLSVLGRDVLKILTPPAFWEASQILPVIVLSYIVLDVNYFFHVGMNLYKKTSYLAYAVGGSALLNLLLNYLLIPPLHAWGAAWATLLSFVVMAAANYVLSQRLYPIQYEHSRLVKMLFMASAIFAVSKLIHIDSLASSVAIDLLLLATFPFMLWMVSFYRDDEIEMVRSFKNLIVGRMRVAL